VLGSLTGGADCFLVHGGEAAGDVDGGSVLRVLDDGVDLLRIKQARGVRRCAREWGRCLGPRGGTVTFGGVGIARRCLQARWIPVTDFVGWGRNRRERKGEAREEVEGVL
jgi:hypothetical protein